MRETQMIDLLAELYPDCFMTHGPYRPLKRGIHHDLAGVLTPSECRQVLRPYVSRRGYLCAIAAGGARYGLDGNPCGDITVEEQQIAMASIDAIRERERLRRQEGVAAFKALQARHTPKKLGLADLKRAAEARRASAGAPACV